MIDYTCISGVVVLCTGIYAVYRLSTAEIRAKHEERKSMIEARKELASKLINKSPAEIKRHLDAMLPQELLDENRSKELYKIGDYTIYNAKRGQVQLIDDGVKMYYWPVLGKAVVQLGNAEEIRGIAEESEDPTAYLEAIIAKAEAVLREQIITQKRKRIV